MQGCVSLLAPECAVSVFVCVFVCVISKQCTVKKHIMCQTLVNLMPCCIKHTSRSFSGTKRYQDLKCVDPLNNTSNVASSLIQPKKQENRKSSGVGGDRTVRRKGWTKFEKGGRQYSGTGGSS